MKEFLIGLLVIVAVLLLAGLGVLLFPLLFVLGFALRLLILVAAVLFAVWLVGKLTLVVIDALRRKETG
ncbi:MAG: hypothetical protein BWY42_01152 [Candidatus Omnitrophica bacterium ADurb.Bin277]|nr:MAG: hypothetical protein BWY42_01152 [Candidatus Omnitrophica bacterium ADurb.Bin277]